jgi:hypothetical protein
MIIFFSTPIKDCKKTQIHEKIMCQYILSILGVNLGSWDIVHIHGVFIHLGTMFLLSISLSMLIVVIHNKKNK